MSTTVETATQIRPFKVEIAQDELDDLRRRIATTRLPSKELVDDRSQGVQLATVQELARYWGEDYDFGRILAKLNALPQFSRSAHRAERCSELLREQLRLLPGGEVAALVDLVEAGQVGVGTLGPAARWSMSRTWVSFLRRGTLSRNEVSVSPTQ